MTWVRWLRRLEVEADAEAGRAVSEPLMLAPGMRSSWARPRMTSRQVAAVMVPAMEAERKRFDFSVSRGMAW